MHHSGCLGEQDIFYVGNIKSVDRIYRQTFVETYSAVVFTKLYISITAITSADSLNDNVLIIFTQQQLAVPRMLADRVTEYGGRMDEMLQR